MHLSYHRTKLSTRYDDSVRYISNWPLKYCTFAAEQASERDCSYKDEHNCIVKFVYGFDEYGSVRVRVQKEPICPAPIPVMAIGFGLLGAILLAGLIALLLYKISVHLYDKKQYARFLEDQKNAKWNRV